VAFDRKKKGKGEGFGMGDATQRKEGRGPGSVTPHGGGQHGGGRLAVGKARGRWRRWPVSCLPREQGSGAARVSQPGKEGAGPGPIEHC
jgi:hypothetical protein